jgi:hypothetical protein
MRHSRVVGTSDTFCKNPESTETKFLTERTDLGYTGNSKPNSCTSSSDNKSKCSQRYRWTSRSLLHNQNNVWSIINRWLSTDGNSQMHYTRGNSGSSSCGSSNFGGYPFFQLLKTRHSSSDHY